MGWLITFACTSLYGFYDQFRVNISLKKKNDSFLMFSAFEAAEKICTQEDFIIHINAMQFITPCEKYIFIYIFRVFYLKELYINCRKSLFSWNIKSLKPL